MDLGAAEHEPGAKAELLVKLADRSLVIWKTKTTRLPLEALRMVGFTRAAAIPVARDWPKTDDLA